MTKFNDYDRRDLEKDIGTCRLSKLTKEQQELYESDIKAKSDWKGGMDWAKEQAAKEATRKTLFNVAFEMKKQGISNEQIVEITKLSIEEIEKLQSI